MRRVGIVKQSWTRAGVGIALAAALQALPASAQMPGGSESRGQMLYRNHCVACHTTQMHWRDKKLVNDWVTLKVQVRRWQGAAQLNWSEADVDDVARYLNDSFYKIPGGGRLAALPPQPPR